MPQWPPCTSAIWHTRRRGAELCRVASQARCALPALLGGTSFTELGITSRAELGCVSYTAGVQRCIHWTGPARTLYALL